MAGPWVDWEMLRIQETSAVLGLHPWVFGFPPPHCSPLHPPGAVFSIRSVTQVCKSRMCSSSQFLGSSSCVPKGEGLLAPWFGMCRLLLLWRQVRPGAGTQHVPSSDPEPSFESTFPLAHAVFFMLNLLTVWSINQNMIKYLVLKQIAIFIAFEKCAIGREYKA